MSMTQSTRRSFLASSAATLLMTPFARSFAATARSGTASVAPGEVLRIEAVELIELHGRYTEEAGVNGQHQVNPEDVYDNLRPAPYKDQPSGKKEVRTSAVYLRIRTSGGIEGLYGPIEKAPARRGFVVVCRQSSGQQRPGRASLRRARRAVGGRLPARRGVSRRWRRRRRKRGRPPALGIGRRSGAGSPSCSR